MKKILIIGIMLTSFSINAQWGTKKVKILDTKINQKELCANLGESNKCNPFIYGQCYFRGTTMDVS